MDKRKRTLLIAIAAILIPSAQAGVIFSQDFSSAVTTSVSPFMNYGQPNSGQWDTINWSGFTGGIIDQSLQFTGDGKGSGWFARITDFNPEPTAMIYSFLLGVAGNNQQQGSVAVWQVGAGFGMTTGAELTTSVHSRFGLGFTSTPGTYQLLNMTGGHSGDIVGDKTITWVINNSGASLNYLAPDNTQHTVANDTWDLWAGPTPVFTGVSAETHDRALTDLKFAFKDGTGTIKMDNFSISTLPIVPEPRATGQLALLFLAAVILAGTIRGKLS